MTYRRGVLGKKYAHTLRPGENPYQAVLDFDQRMIDSESGFIYPESPGVSMHSSSGYTPASSTIKVHPDGSRARGFNHSNGKIYGVLRRKGFQDQFPWDDIQLPLTRNMSNRYVLALQRVLCVIGYTKWLAPGYDDGIFGPQTERAVAHFQHLVGAEPDGIVGVLTSSALRQRCQRHGMSPRSASVTPCKRNHFQTRG